MFTGLVETTGKVEKFKISNEGAKIIFSTKLSDFEEIKIGDSVAVNGVCLTITSIKDKNYEADVMMETLNITNLKNLKYGDEINLERAMKISSRFDGHIVQGHIDNIALVSKITNDGFSKRVFFNCNSTLVIKKGSIAVNGVSLTVSDVNDNGFEVSLIPETIKNTNLKNLKLDDKVNIEYDLFAKYVEKFISKFAVENQKKEITLEFLKQNGF